MRSGDFAATRWSVVLRSRAAEESVARAALSELCSVYWYPLYAFARRCGHTHHEAEDLTQGLFANLLRRASLNGADPGRGRFRSFLLGAMKHHMADEHARADALKRGSGLAALPLETAAGDARYASEPVDPAPPEIGYDRRWATELLHRAMQALETEYAQAGKREIFDVLQPQIIVDVPDGACAEAARRLALNEGHVRVLAHRLRHRFGKLLRQQVADTVGSETDVDDELRHLVACLRQSNASRDGA